MPYQCNSKLRKLVNNCLRFEPERRPNFDHILNYLDSSQILTEQQEPVAQPINKLFDLIA